MEFDEPSMETTTLMTDKQILWVAYYLPVRGLFQLLEWLPVFCFETKLKMLLKIL